MGGDRVLPSRSALVMGLSLVLLTAACHHPSSPATPSANRSTALRQASDEIDVSGRAASPTAVYTTSAAILYDASRQPLTIVSAQPRQLDGLQVVSVRIAPFGTGFAAGAGLAGPPEAQPTTAPIQLQSIGPGRNSLPPLGRVVAGVDPPVAVARWLVVAYRLAPGRSQGSLHDLVLRYTTAHGAGGQTTVRFSVRLCLGTRCATTSTTGATGAPTPSSPSSPTGTAGSVAP